MQPAVHEFIRRVHACADGDQAAQDCLHCLVSKRQSNSRALKLFMRGQAKAKQGGTSCDQGNALNEDNIKLDKLCVHARVQSRRDLPHPQQLVYGAHSRGMECSHVCRCSTCKSLFAKPCMFAQVNAKLGKAESIFCGMGGMAWTRSFIELRSRCGARACARR